MDRNLPVPPGYRPRIVQFRLDGVMVIQVDEGLGGDLIEELSAGYKPALLEILWDGQVIYAQSQDEVLVDRLSAVIRAEAAGSIEGNEEPVGHAW